MNAIQGFGAATDWLQYLQYFNNTPDTLRPAFRIGEPWNGEKIPQEWLNFRVYYSWEQYITLAKSLASKIRESGSSYTRVVWLSKWWCFIADMVAHELALPLGFIGLQSYSWDTQSSGMKETFNAIPENPGKVLVIDDMRDSGKSLRFLREKYTESLGDFDVATLLTKDRPDAKDIVVKYTVFEDHPAIWVVQPGEWDFENPTAWHDVWIGTFWAYKNITQEAQKLAESIREHTSIIAYSDWQNPQYNSAYPMWVALARITWKPFFPVTPATKDNVWAIIEQGKILLWKMPYVHTNDTSFSI